MTSQVRNLRCRSIGVRDATDLYPIHTTAENAHRCALMRILEFAPFTLQPQCAAKRILCPSEAKRSEAKRSEF